jgi:hypothetical protein
MAYRDKEQERDAHRAYYVANRERCLEASKQWARDNPDRVREIKKRSEAKRAERIPAQRRDRRLRHLEREKLRERRYRETHRERALLKSARRRAAKHGLEFTITEKDIVIPEVCPIRGTPFTIGTRQYRADSPSLDRIEPHRGYVPGNVWVISTRANVVKNDGTPDEHEQIAAAVRKRLKENQQ